MLFVHNRQPEWERESTSSLCLDSSRQQKASCCCCCPTLSSPFFPFTLSPRHSFLLPLLFWLSYFVLSRCLHDTPLWWSKVSHSDPLCSPGCNSQQRTLSPPYLPLSHSFAYHINSSGCLFFLSIVYFLVSVFPALLSDPEHSKKAKKSKNVDLLLLLMLLLFLCRLLLKA